MEIRHPLIPDQIHQVEQRLDTAHVRRSCPLCDGSSWAYGLAGDQFILSRRCNGCGAYQTFELATLQLALHLETIGSDRDIHSNYHFVAPDDPRAKRRTDPRMPTVY